MSNEDELNDAQKAGKRKQKRQLVVLGVLSLVLGGLVFSQLGGDESYSVAKLSSASAMEDPAEDAGASEEDDAVEAGTDNPVLSEAPKEELDSNPFSAFWSTSVDHVEETQLQAPTVTLNATMPDADQPVAIIDGRLHFIGDLVQGWKLDEVRSRAIVLRAPNDEWVTVDMPLLYGRIDVPQPLPVAQPQNTGTAASLPEAGQR